MAESSTSKADEYRAALAAYRTARDYWEAYLAKLSGQAKAEGCSHPGDLQHYYEERNDYYAMAFVTVCRVCGAKRKGRYSGDGDWTYDIL